MEKFKKINVTLNEKRRNESEQNMYSPKVENVAMKICKGHRGERRVLQTEHEKQCKGLQYIRRKKQKERYEKKENVF